MSEDIKESIKELEVTLSRLSREVAEARSQTDDIDTSYLVGELKDALDSIEGDIDMVNNALEEVRDNVVETDEYVDARNAQKRLGRNIADVLNLMSIGAQRYATLQHTAFDDSDFTLSSLSANDLNTKADSTYALYWMLIDFFGYSDEDFRLKLTSKKLDYTFRDKQEHA